MCCSFSVLLEWLRNFSAGGVVFQENIVTFADSKRLNYKPHKRLNNQPMRKRIMALSMLMACSMGLKAQHIVTPLNPAGVLEEAQWRGRWIGIDRLLPGEDMTNKTRVNARYLREEFPLQKKRVRSAKAFVAAMGYYELYVNGQRIGDHVLTPIQTDFRKSITYNALDVTSAISVGDTACVGVVLGNGRTVPMRYLKHYKCPFFGFPKCRVDIFVEYEDGSRQRLSSSEKWKATAQGPIRSNNEYDGEVYDARMEMPRWSETGFDDSAWQQAERAELPIGTLYPQTTPNQVATPLERYDGIGSSTMWSKDGKSVIIDVQQNIAGWMALRMRGGRGDTIRVKYAERLNADSTLYIANLRDAETEDKYVCNGDEGGGRWWHPTFVYHGFRYVQVTGMPSLTLDDIRPCVVANGIETIGTFVSSNATLNRVYRNAWWGILDNYKGFPVDCPQRNERQPWLGDRTAGSLGESYLFDNNTLYTHWMRDICDAQRSDGAIPDVAPAFWNYYSDIVTWPAALPFTCEMLYRQFGNDEAIRNSYPYIRKWIDHMCATYQKDGIITKDKYGDWCMPPEKPEMIHSEDPARKTDGALLSTAYMVHIMNMMADFARVQGMEDDAKVFTERARVMAEAFNRKFLHVKRGTSPEPGHPLYPDSVYYGNNTATANVLPLAFGIVPDDCRRDVASQVVRNIIVDNGGHVSCGVIGISHLLRTLTANGYGDVAFLIATNKTYPSWGYMAEHGATTIWELWNGDTANPAMNSGNHVMLLGDLLTWCYQDLAGIRNAEGSAGYRHLDMKPDFSIQDLDSISATYRTPQGVVESHWKKDLERIVWTVTLPKGTTADCHLPDGTVRTLKEGTTRMEAAISEEAPFNSPGRGRARSEEPTAGGRRGSQLKETGLAVVENSFIYDQSIYPETHSASLVELEDGTLLATYFGGTKERVPDVCIYTQRKERGAREWSAPVLAADGVFTTGTERARRAGIDTSCVKAHFGPCIKHGLDWDASKNRIAMTWEEALDFSDNEEGIEQRKACWNPVLFQMPDGEVWLFFKIGKNVKDWTGWLCKSRDGGRTWSDKEPLPEGFLGPIKNKPELIDGRLVCASSTENDGWKIHFETLDIATGQWTKQMPGNRKDVLCIQPAILRHGNNTLQVVARTRPTNEQRKGQVNTRGKIATCWSFDNGRTWGETSLLDVPNNQSGIDAVTLAKPVTMKVKGERIKDVRHVMIYNNFGTLPGTNKGPRTPVSIAVSTDGVTWHHALTLEDSPISQYSYPAIIQGKDGSLHVAYTWRRQRIAYKRIEFK